MCRICENPNAFRIGGIGIGGGGPRRALLCVYVCMYVCVCMECRMSSLMYVCLCVCMYVYVGMCMECRMRSLMYVCLCVCMYVCVWNAG